MPSNVVRHGVLPRKKYEAIVAAADVGIGPLAMHRKNLSEASSLKVREYLAYGIPTIIGCRDADFPNGAEFLLQLPNTEDNVDSNLALIAEFVERSRGLRISRGRVSHLDSQVKEAKRVDFFHRILEQSRACGKGDSRL
jgi:hypothetical protein